MDGFDLRSLSVNLLQSKAQANLLDRIAELRKLGFNRRILLPQLVLCGDQNSGKSSVFEAITGISLPVNDGICTRFATEVVLKRSPQTGAHVKIRPGPTASPDHRRKLSAFARSYNWLQDAAKLFSEARLIMGLIREGGYTLDVLQLEVSGPTLPDLTVVDLPGLLHSPGLNQTREDVAIAQQLTESYMNNPRNIILAIFSAEYPLSQQAVLHMISSCAPRTMGIIVKPDVLEPDSIGEDSFSLRLRNQDSPLRLGWHLLKNLDTKEKKPKELTRDDMENMFISSTPPWNYVNPNVLGIDSLRSRLSKIILGQTELQLTTLASGIQKDLEANRTMLEQLGPSRTSSTERRLFLTHIGERFTSLTKAATLGEYDDSYFRSQPTCSARQLRSALRRWAENFATDMETRAHSYDIYDDYTNEQPRTPRPPLSPEDPQPVPRSEFISGLSELLRQNKDRDLSGLINAQVVGELFIRYSMKWTSMAKAHVFEVWKKVKVFLDDLLHYIAGANVGAVILRVILNHEMETRLENLNRKIEELTRPYKKVIPATLNSQLNARIKELRRKSGDEQRAGDDLGVDHDSLLCSELLDCMQVYYGISLGVFVDNVANLAVENCLVNDLEELISPSKINQMSDEEIEQLTAESEDIERSRNQAQRRIQLLEIAAAACTKCEMSALESVAQNYRALSKDRNTQDSITTVVSSDSSTSPQLSPITDPDSYPAPASRVPSKSPKPVTPVLRAFPPPTRPPDSALPQTPASGKDEWPRSEYSHSLSPAPLEKQPSHTPPPPPLPTKSISRSVSVTSNASSKDTASLSSSKTSTRKRNSKSKPPPYPSLGTFGVFCPICELLPLINSDAFFSLTCN